MKRFLLPLLVLVLAVAGCGGGESKSQGASDQATTTTEAKKVGKPKTAEDVVTALKTEGLPIGEVDVYTAENDPNHKLGRPNGYTSKINFRDTRFEMDRDSDGFINAYSGGSVEVFEDHALAQDRSDYLDAVAKGFPMLTEYHYVQGATLLRISKVATPDQAAAYETALKALHVG